jgi:serine protease inhibitor
MRRHTLQIRAGTGLVLAAASVLLAGCTLAAIGTTQVEAGPPRNPGARFEPRALSAAIDGFGLDLLKATKAGETGNVIVSPASVHAALSMTVNGATDETAKQMRAVLRTAAMSPTDANAQWASLLLQLGSRSSDQTLEIANSLWAEKSVAFKKPFLDADRDFFGAKVTTLDFATDNLAGAVNGWVSSRTHGMITKMVDRVPDNAILYLANAVYFKGDWVSPFEHNSTDKEPFTRADGTKVDVDMMNATEGRPFAENGALQATSLAYVGADTGFYVMLPRPGVSIDAAMASLEGTGFADLRATLTSGVTTEVVLGLPKLDADFGTSLKKPLATMGMPRAFDQDLAQFSGMADLGVPIYIGDVMHKTKVKVDEKGTEAAAATVVEMLAGSAPARIVCDRPYLFAIVDQRTGVMLFLGVVEDPTK